MPRPIELRCVLKTLSTHGFIFVSQKGSHAKFRRDGKTVIVKMVKKEIPYGTFALSLRNLVSKKKTLVKQKRHQLPDVLFV